MPGEAQYHSQEEIPCEGEHAQEAVEQHAGYTPAWVAHLMPETIMLGLSTMPSSATFWYDSWVKVSCSIHEVTSSQTCAVLSRSWTRGHNSNAPHRRA